MNRLAAFALWLHGRLLRRYPRRFREQFGDEMAHVFAQSVHDASAAGNRPLLILLARELRDWPASCLREHLHERNRRLPERQLAPPTGWGALATAFPFLFFLILFIFIPASFILIPAILAVGVLIAWFRRWPGWIVAWLGFLIFIGQNWLPTVLLGAQYYNNPSRSIASQAFENLLLPIFWYGVFYLVIRRWPRHGLLVGLPFLILPWVFSMEFASGAMSSVVYGAQSLLLALFAVAIYLQRRTAGDIWLFYLAALLPGAIITFGAVRFSPGMENEWQSYGGNVLEALVPFVAILLLASLHTWARENGPSARRAAIVLTAGFSLAFIALLTIPRLLLPTFLDDIQAVLLPILSAAWLLGVLLILWGGWRLRILLPRRHVVLITIPFLLLPFLQRPDLLFLTVNDLTYNQRDLADLRDMLPIFSTADAVIAGAGAAGLLLLPSTIAHLRRHTAAFPPFQATTGGLLARQLSEQPGAATAQAAQPAANRRKRLALLAALPLLIGGGAFFGLVFLPLQLEAEPYTSAVALGDIDGDGDLDAVLANTLRLLPTADNRLLLNDGQGAFTAGQHQVGRGATDAIIVGASGGDVAIVVAGMGGAQLLTNEGDRFVSAAVVGIPTPPENGASQYYVDAGDLNGDGTIDIFLAGCCGFGVSNYPEPNRWIPAANRVLFGRDGNLYDSGQALGVRGSQAVALGDLDGDGDLDAFIGNTQTSGEDLQNDEPNEVWLNDGNGYFTHSGQLLGSQGTYAVALGDVDGDGDLDALVGNEGEDELWLNDGQGRFTLSEQSWNRRRTLQLFLVDLDGDGDLDAVTAHELSTTFVWYRQAIIWWNDGSGAFTRDRHTIRYRPNAALAIGDVTGAGHPTILSAALDAITLHFP